MARWQPSRLVSDVPGAYSTPLAAYGGDLGVQGFAAPSYQMGSLRAVAAACAAGSDVPLEEVGLMANEPHVERIAANCGREVSEEVAFAIKSRTATLQRKDWFQNILS